MDLTNADVADILALLDSLPYDELDLQTASFRLTLRRTPDGWTQSTEFLSAPAPLDGGRERAGGGADGVNRSRVADGAEGAGTGAAGGAEAGAEVSAEAGIGLVTVRAPLPGTFFRAPRPGAAPFVEVGSRVGADTVVGIVETMKLMNSVHAGADGMVAEICLGNAEFAARGATLLRIRAISEQRLVARERLVGRAHCILRRVLIANRGEIAVRILRTCRRLGIETVLAVSDADACSVPARLADETIRIGGASADLADTYLNVAAVVAAAVAAGADAIHPGYGFLSENPRLARACEAAGIVFIGPDADVLDAAGDKLAARRHAIAAGLPVLPGGPAEPADADGAGALAGRIGYPVLVKAAGGGGGRGLRVVSDPVQLAEAVAVASAEAEAAFGDGRMYLERYVSPARHVEVQLLGDGENVIHLGDRDCSVQRRYQKLIEEAPAPLLGETLRVGMRAAAVALGQQLKYRGLGTVEFLVDTRRAAFWFLEVNARIQVEHPVTEMITGLDLVAEHIAIAEGRGLRLSQASVRLDGHAIECRINAEDPAAGFRPSPGTVTSAVFPAGSDIRVDTHIQAGSAVPPQYDSLLAKLIVGGASRAETLARLRGALARCEIGGVATNTGMHLAVTADEEFASGGVSTGYLARLLEHEPGPVPNNDLGRNRG